MPIIRDTTMPITRDTVKRCTTVYADKSSPLSQAETNDCGVRALAVLLGVGYDQAHALLKEQGRRDREGTNHYQMEGAMRKQGVTIGRILLRRVSAPRRDRWGFTIQRTYCQTLAQVIKGHPKGSYLVGSATHWFALVDGVVHDWGRSTSGSRTRVRILTKVEG